VAYQTGVLEALNDWGVNYREYPGCRTRGYSSFWPLGMVEHHDAIEARWTYPPSIFANGRPPPNYLPGPITNFCNTFDGIVWVIALGAANHAGTGSWRGIYGNSKVWGLEQQNAGNGVQVYPDAQIESTVLLTSALAEFSGFDASMVCRHAEWTSRKIDPYGPWQDGHLWQNDMDHFRALVAQGGTPDMTEAESKMLVEIHQELFGQPKFGYPKLRDAATGLMIAKAKGSRQGWITNGIVKVKAQKGLGGFLANRGVPKVEMDPEVLGAIPVVGE
jgi:hypothetical protein